MNWQKFERFSQKKLTSESFDNDNKLTLKSFFAFCSVFFFKDQRRKDGKDFETETVSGFQNTPELKRAKTYSALSFDRINFFTVCITMSVRHGFLLSVICLVYSATCRPNVFELNEQFTKGNISQLAVTKIDLNGYKRDVWTFQAQDWKDFVMVFRICIREWKVVPRVLRNEELLELTPAVNGSLFKSA